MLEELFRVFPVPVENQRDGMFEPEDEIPLGGGLNRKQGRLVQNLLVKKVMIRLLEEQSDPLTYVESFNKANSAGGRAWQAFCDDNSQRIVSDSNLCTMFIKTLWKLISNSEDWAGEIHGRAASSADSSSQPADKDQPPSLDSSPPIDLQYAFAFTCTHCGSENTVVGDKLTPTRSTNGTSPTDFPIGR